MTELLSPAIDDLKQMVKEKGSQKAAAEALDISETYIGELIKGNRPLTENVLEKLGYEKVIIHVKTHAVPDVVKAIESAQADAKHFDGLKKRVFKK